MGDRMIGRSIEREREREREETKRAANVQLEKKWESWIRGGEMRGEENDKW